MKFNYRTIKIIFLMKNVKKVLTKIKYYVKIDLSGR